MLCDHGREGFCLLCGGRRMPDDVAEPAQGGKIVVVAGDAV